MALTLRSGTAGIRLAGIVIMFALLALIQGASGLTVDHESDAGLPGEDVVFELSLTNDGPGNDVADILANSSLGWNLSCPGSLSVPAGESRNFTLAVIVYEHAMVDDMDEVTVRAEFRDSGAGSSLGVTVSVIQFYDMEASLTYDTVNAAPSRTARLSVRLANLGNGPDIVNLTVIGPRAGTGGNSTEYLFTMVPVKVDANTTRPLIIALSVSPYATPHSSFNVTVYANSSGGQMYVLPVTVRVDGYDVWVERLNVTGERRGTLIGTGIEADARFETSYWGEESEDLAELRLVVMDPARTVLDEVEAAIRPSDGNTKLLGMDFHKPASVPYGDLIVSAEVWHGDIMWSSEEKVITLVEPDHRFEVRCERTDLEFRPGAGPLEYEIEIDNRGNVDQSFWVSMITQWNFTPSFEAVTLVPGDIAVLRVALAPPLETNGTLVAMVQVRSEETGEVLPVTLRASERKVRGLDDFPFIMLAIAVTAAVGCGIYLTRTEPGWLALLSLLPLYYRVTGQDVLDNYIRGKIHGYIIANPGDHYNGIKEVLGINNGTLAYHIKVLERERLIKSRMDGKYKRFYPFESATPGRKLTPIQRLLVEKLVQHPGISQRRLARAIGESVQVVNYHIRNLEVSGVVEVRKMGNRSQVFVAEGWK